jgi:hypothetical protein
MLPQKRHDIDKVSLAGLRLEALLRFCFQGEA